MGGQEGVGGVGEVCTWPKLEKYCSRRSAVVFQLRPPMNSLFSLGTAAIAVCERLTRAPPEEKNHVCSRPFGRGPNPSV